MKRLFSLVLAAGLVWLSWAGLAFSEDASTPCLRTSMPGRSGQPVEVKFCLDMLGEQFSAAQGVYKLVTYGGRITRVNPQGIIAIEDFGGKGASFNSIPSYAVIAPSGAINVFLLVFEDLGDMTLTETYIYTFDPEPNGGYNLVGFWEAHHIGGPAPSDPNYWQYIKCEPPIHFDLVFEPIRR